MPSLFDPAARADVVARLARLDPAARPRWGRLDAPRMVEHLVDWHRMALGELRCADKRTPLRLTPIKQLVIYLLPWPRGAPTAPELLQPPAGAWGARVAECRAVVERFGAEPEGRTWPDHPAFGRMSRRDWGVLAWRHADHHLRQFGV